MNVPENLFYTEDHEWIKLDGNVATIGITDHAQSELGDIVFVELPDIGDAFEKGDSMGTIEAVKTVADIYAPLSGEVIEVNDELADESECMNKSPYEEGWIARIKLEDSEATEGLLTHEQYTELIG